MDLHPKRQYGAPRTGVGMGQARQIERNPRIRSTAAVVTLYVDHDRKNEVLSQIAALEGVRCVALEPEPPPMR